MNFRFVFTAGVLAVALATPVLGQTDDPCRDAGRDRDDDTYRHCEVREESMAAGPPRHQGSDPRSGGLAVVAAGPSIDPARSRANSSDRVRRR